MENDFAKLAALSVHLHHRHIGTILRLAGDRHLFTFEQDYLDDPGRDTLSLGFKGQSGGLVTAARPVTRRLPPFFSNLLPEGPLRGYLAERAGVKPEREFHLLAVLGADMAGAVTVRPVDARGGLSQLQPGALPDPAQPEENAGALRFSLAGVQLKFSAFQNAAGGLTLPAQGVGGSWIVELPSAQFPAVPVNEFVMLELARAVGIPVPEIRLVPVHSIEGLPAEAARIEGQALATRRFDRAPNGERIHMEDFAQVFGLFPDDKYNTRSYSNIASVLSAETGEDGVSDFMRRLTFSVLIGNGDMHLKNWSLVYPDGRTPQMAPAYDFVSTLPYLPAGKLALSFGKSSSLGELTKEQVRRFADTARLPVHPIWRLVKETADRTVQAWESLAQKDLLTTDVRRMIAGQIRRVAGGL